MKKNCKTLLLAALFVIAGMGMAGCKQNVDTSAHVVTNAQNPLENLGFWKTSEVKEEKVDAKANSITINLAHDVDYLAWCKENGEFISLPIPKLSWLRFWVFPM